MISTSTKKNVREHFDIASPFYNQLWGMHIHHGYYATGKETKEKAQENLLKFIASRLALRPRSNVLDIGCGIGGTGIWLARKHGCRTTGITIAPAQIKMAEQNAENAGVSEKLKFLVDDADNLKVHGKFDYAFAIEVLPHLHNPGNFYRKISRLIKPGGRFAISDWFKGTSLTRQQYEKYIKPINFGMMVSLSTPLDYMDYLTKNGFRIVSWNDLNSMVYKTWDIGSKLIMKQELWKLAREHNRHFVNFLKAFMAMRKGFSSGTFRYGVIIAEKV